MKRGRKTVFANELAIDKGIVIPDHASSEEIEMLLDEWVLVDYIDNGFINKDTPCECGRPLRYQYVVKHKSTNETRRFGISHFEEHTGLSAELVKRVKRGFEKIDFEMDEILKKIENGWSLKAIRLSIPNELVLPKDIEEHLIFNIPLLDKQINRLRRLITDFEYDLERQRRKAYRETYEAKENEVQKQAKKKSSIVEESTQSSLFDFDFTDEIAEEKEEVVVRLPLGNALTNELKDAVLDYLVDTKSTRIICELLIKNNHASDKRYLTNKPKIYLQVVLFLESMVKDGIVEFEGKIDTTDRLYKSVI